MIALSMAVAVACPPTAQEVARARAAFDDAEVELASEVVSRAMDDLGCQEDVVAPGTLLELYRLDGLVALSVMDQKDAVYATIRAVTMDPASPPPSLYGPELAELYTTWAERLSNATVTIGIRGGGLVYVDGTPLTHGALRQMVAGEHLIQVQGNGFASRVVDFKQDRIIDTGLPAPVGIPDPVLPSEAPVPVPEPPLPVPVPDPAGPVGPSGGAEPKRPARRRPAALWIAGGAAAALGAGAFGYALYQDEVVWDTRSFPDQASVDRAATQINAAYGTGYGLMGVGGVLLVRNAVGFKFR